MSSATYTQLLPANQTPLEGALVQSVDSPAATVAATDEVGTLYRPAELRAAWLPWLAWAWDALYWSDEADESVRREILRRAWWLHRIAGTERSYAVVARQAGFRLIRAIRPPDKLFLGADMSTAQRNAWLRQFPQLRVYPFRRRGTATGAHLGQTYTGQGAADFEAMYVSDGAGGYKVLQVSDGAGGWETVYTQLTNQAAAAACWPAIGDAAARLGEQRYLYRNGVETALKWVEVERTTRDGVAVSARETRLPDTKGWHTWLGLHARYTAATTAPARVLTTYDETPYMERTAAARIRTLAPGAEPIRTQYEWVTARQSRDSLLRSGVFLSCRRALGPDVADCRAKTGGGACGFVASVTARQDAHLRVYRRVYLHDPAAVPVSRTVASHLDVRRLGMPAYHARLDVDLRRMMSDRAAYAGGAYVGRHTCDHRAGLRIRHARNALGPLRAARDRAWLRTAIHAPVAASNQITCSPDLVSGQYTAEAA